MHRRDFSRNIARFGFGGALALLLGIRKAEANTCFWQYTPSSCCESYRAWCCSGWGCGSASLVSHNNCAWCGHGSMCCG